MRLGEKKNLFDYMANCDWMCLRLKFHVLMILILVQSLDCVYGTVVSMMELDCVLKCDEHFIRNVRYLFIM